MQTPVKRPVFSLSCFLSTSERGVSTQGERMRSSSVSFYLLSLKMRLLACFCAFASLSPCLKSLSSQPLAPSSLSEECVHLSCVTAPPAFFHSLGSSVCVLASLFWLSTNGSRRARAVSIAYAQSSASSTPPSVYRGSRRRIFTRFPPLSSYPSSPLASLLDALCPGEKNETREEGQNERRRDGRRGRLLSVGRRKDEPGRHGKRRTRTGLVSPPFGRKTNERGKARSLARKRRKNTASEKQLGAVSAGSYHET